MKAVIGNGCVSSDHKSCVNADSRLVAPSRRPTVVAPGRGGRLAAVSNEWLQLTHPNLSVGALVGGVTQSVFTGMGCKAL